MAEKKRKRLTRREFWDKYGEQFARTDRHYEEAKERWARQAAKCEALRKGEAGQDAA